MIKVNEGYIKFNIDWEEKPFHFRDDDFETINSFRQKLFELNLIGVYPDGIGFGNISIRYQNNEFIISGSTTGSIKTLKKEHYSLVKDFDIKKNWVRCIGNIKASSESLSHGIIYKSNTEVNAVIHAHHSLMWEKHLNILPTTNIKAGFGTPEIAVEIQKLAINQKGIIIMGGHPEGIITYGKTLKEAYDILIQYFNNL